MSSKIRRGIQDRERDWKVIYKWIVVELKVVYGVQYEYEEKGANTGNENRLVHMRRKIH